MIIIYEEVFCYFEIGGELWYFVVIVVVKEIEVNKKVFLIVRGFYIFLGILCVLKKLVIKIYFFE